MRKILIFEGEMVFGKHGASAGIRGSAAIAGFLYQLLGTGARLLVATIEQRGIENACSIQAIVEPLAGGDALVESPQRICSQFKLRSKPIDAGILAGSILPDLFGAHCDTECSRYDIVLNQRLTGPAQKLVEALQAAAAPGGKQAAMWERARAACRDRFVSGGGRHERFETQFRQFGKRLHLADPVDLASSREHLAGLLYSQVPYSNLIEEKIDQLVGRLLSVASNNGGRITAEALSEVLDLPSASSPVAKLRAGLKASLKARQYNSDLDVRPSLPLSMTAAVEVVAGPSGNGKSWALCRLAADTVDQGRAAVLIRATTRSELENELQRIVAIDGLGHENPIAASALGKLWQRRTGDDSGLLVLWEGCKEPDILLRLHHQNGLGRGLQLVAELPAEAERSPFEDAGLFPHSVTGFGELQLFDALEKRGVDAGAVPASIRRMLRHPVLCGIYAELARDNRAWKPENEYLVLERFWDRARTKGGKLACARLQKLARELIERDRFEVSEMEIFDLGFDEEMLGSLIGAGWISHLSGKWRFAHDRLLTWAMAKHLAHLFLHLQPDAREIADQIGRLENSSPEDRSGLHGLGFLMMDVLWCLTAEKRDPHRVAQLLAHLEDDRQRLSSSEFYGELVPTIGTPVIDVLLERFELDPDSWSDAYRIGNIAAALLALDIPEAKRKKIVDRLAAGEERAWKLLMLLGATWPLNLHKDRVWEDFLGAYRSLGSADSDFTAFETTREALSTICRKEPAWLDAKIAGTDDPKALGAGLILLQEVDPSPAVMRWADLSEHLFEHVHEDNFGKLVGFVQRTRDTARIPFLIKLIETGSHCSARALSALAMLDPEQALEEIERRPPVSHPPAAGLWLDRLLEHTPARADDAVRTWLLARDPSGRFLALLWTGAKARASDSTLAALLTLLETELAPEDETRSAEGRILLDLLGSEKIDPAADHVFHTMQGSDLARRLRELLAPKTSRLRESQAKQLWTLLRRIGGADFETHVIGLLDGEAEHRGLGVASSIYVPTEAVIDRLQGMAGDWRTAYPHPLRKAVWHVLASLRPDPWYARMLGLLRSKKSARIALGLDLFKELGFDEDAPVLLESVRNAQPGSDLEARAINRAAAHGVRDALLLERALPRFDKSGDTEGHVAACNVLLHERGQNERDLLDAFLMDFTRKSSWNSSDMSLLAIRLHQDDVPDELLTAAKPFLARRSLFGESLFTPYLERADPAAKDLVIERAFSPPSILTNDLPDAIGALAEIDAVKAGQAFAQAWKETPARRRYLVSCARELGIEAVHAMLSDLPSKDDDRDAAIAFRQMCVELRRRHEEALPVLDSFYADAVGEKRTALLKIYAWMPGAPAILDRIADSEPDVAAREQAEELAISARRREESVTAYRNDAGSMPKLIHVLETVDPAMLYWSKDPWCIIDAIQKRGHHILIAEEILLRRLNDLAKTRYRRIGIRPLEKLRESKGDAGT